MTGPIDIVVFAPHPDDGEIGCGGLLALARRRGRSTAIVDMTAGEAGTRGSVAVRAAEAAEAAKVLDLTMRENLGLPDTGVGQASDHENKVVDCLKRLRPRIIAVPHPAERHPDHSAAGVLVERARQLAALGPQAHRTDLVLRYGVHAHFDPTLVLDTTSVWDQRMAAILCHASQVTQIGPDPDSPLSDGRFLDYIDARARYFGAMVGACYGEPYQSDRPLRLGALDALFEAPQTSRYRSGP